MLINVIAAASMLLSGFSAPSSVESKAMDVVQCEVVVSQKDISANTLRIIIEEHAAPYWGLTNAEAWQYYSDAEMVVYEIVPNLLYTVHFDGILEIVMSGED